MHTRTKAISAFHPSSAEPSPSHHADKSTPNTGLVKPKIATLETGLYFNRMPRFSVGFLSFFASLYVIFSRSGNGCHPPGCVPHPWLLCGCFSDYPGSSSMISGCSSFSSLMNMHKKLISRIVQEIQIVFAPMYPIICPPNAAPTANRKMIPK